MKMEFTKEYPKKVLAIYEAVGRLLAAGRDTGKLTVSDITREAGIGKGTAYEYFGSKEEIIGRGICYQMHKTVAEMTERLEDASTLMEQLKIVIEWTDNSFSTNMMYGFFKLQMNSDGDAREIEKKVNELAAVRNCFIEKISDIILQKAVSEGVIPPQEDVAYARMVVSMVLVTMAETCISRIKGGTFAGMEPEKILEYAMRILRGSLN